MKKIAIIMPYFGHFPEWSDLFFETVKKNSTIDFIFYTDCPIEKYPAKNIKYHKLSMEEYVAKVNQFLDFNFQPKNAYKLVDLRPLFGTIFKSDLQEYDFYGWTDIDVLYGDIRSFYTPEILSKYDVLSTHEMRISGHLALFRNNERNREMYKSIYDWKNKLNYPEIAELDEIGNIYEYTMTFFDKFNQKFKTNINNFFTKALKKRKTRRLYLKEQYTTPFTPIPWLDGSKYSKQPDTWYYKDGEITNSRDAERNFIYIHFMNFKNSKWRHDGTKAPWEGGQKICFAKPEDMQQGIRIDKNGIMPI